MPAKAPMVLVVEDDRTMALLLEEELRDEGYEVQVVYSGDEAVRICENAPPAVVVLDINMPGKDGIETLDELAHLRGTLPVILHTAYSAYQENYRTWLAMDYVVKSSDFKELKQSVARAVAQTA
jgi:CheY-like chemotaxis protein